MYINIEKKYTSEFDVYHALISFYNVIDKWGLTETHIKILVYLIRFGYSKDTKKIICDNVNMTLESLTTNLSHLRNGRVGKKKIKKLLKTSRNNMNITLLGPELNDIKKLLESNESTKALIIDIGEKKIIDTYVDAIKKLSNKK